MEILAAMRRCGYRHDIGGRPVPGDPLPTIEKATERVVALVVASPYAKHVGVEPDDVERVVRDHYLDVEPWPFGALVG